MPGYRRKYNVRQRLRRRIKRKVAYKRKKYFKKPRLATRKIGFPSSRCVRLRYVENLNLQLQNLKQYTYQFNVGSCYDPNYSGSGHQPYGFDQWCNFYRRYTVLGAKLTFRAVMRDQEYANNASSVPLAMGAYLVPSSQLGSALTIPEIQEKGLSKVVLLSNNPNNSRCYGTIVKKYSPRKFFGVPPMMETRVMGADVGNDPVQTAYCIVAVGTMDGQNYPNDSCVMNYNVQIDYLVKFTEPRVMESS